MKNWIWIIIFYAITLGGLSAAEAARFLGKTNKHAHQNISNCVNGRSKTAYGYWWKFSKKTIDSFLEEC